MKEELAMREAVSMYNDRMKSISAEFDLNEAEEEVIASEVKAIGMDSEDFEKYTAKLKVLMSSKLRENLSKEHYGEKSMASEDVKEEAVEIKKETETSKASDENETEIEIEISESSDLCVTNNNGQVSEEETLIERLKKTGLTLA
jgi:biotin-(acetyl-CoA carboxylase) ligase